MRRAALIGVLCALLAAGLRAVAHDEATAAETYEDVYYLPPPGWLRVLSLGHHEALADLLWCRALVYMGDEFAHQGSLRFVFEYTESMLALDPDFLAVYRWIGTAAVYQPEGTDAAEVERAVAIMERGRERFPEDGELAWITGATLAFELRPLVPQERRADVRLRGVEHLLDAIRLGAAPDWLLLSSSSMLAELGRAEMAARFLEEMYGSIHDPGVRAEIARRIADVESEAFASAFVEAEEEEENQRLRALPYLSPSLYFLVGERPGESWQEAMRKGFGAAVIEAPLFEGEDVEATGHQP
ncbi:MAG: hypothetical protein OHK0013_31140 [Sandaracinaceae bacterium]